MTPILPFAPHTDPARIERAWWTRLACLVLAVLPSDQVLHIGADDPALVEELVARGVEAFGLRQTAGTRPPRCGAERFRTSTIEDAADDARRFSTVLCSLTAIEAERAVKRLVPVLTSSCTRHALLMFHGHPEHPIGPDVRQRIDERLCRAGFRRHPARFHFHPYDPSEADGRTLILAFERVPGLIAAESDDLPRDLLMGSDASDAEARYVLAGHLIKRQDVVVDAACGAGAGAAILYDHGSVCARVLAVDDREGALAYAARTYGASRPGLSFVHGDAAFLQPVADATADLVAALDPEWTIGQSDRFLEHALRVLLPGGRLIVALPAAESGEWLSGLRRLFLVERVFAQVSQRDEHGVVTRAIVDVGSERETAITPAWWIVVAIKDPIVHHASRPESIDHPRLRLPSVDVGPHTEGYVNPWLPHGIVQVNRSTNTETLVDMARRALEEAPGYTPDRGAALAVLGYRRLEGQEPASSRSLPLEHWIEELVARPPRTHQEVRWCISNQYLLARLHLRAGRPRDAEAAFARCAAMDEMAQDALRATGVASCALIATKTVDAAFWAGWLASRRQDRAAARVHWTRGIASAGRAVIDGWRAYTGPRVSATPYGLYEASQILAAANRCEQALAWLNLDDRRLADLPTLLPGSGDYSTPVPYISREAFIRRQASAQVSTPAQRGLVAFLLHHVSRPIYLWGAGAAGRRFAELAGERFTRITAFVDGAPAKQDGMMVGKRIVGPDVLAHAASETPRPFVIVTSRFSDEILTVLTDLGYRSPDDVFVFDA